MKKIIKGAIFGLLSLTLLSSACEEKVEEMAKVEGGIKAKVITTYEADGCPFLVEIEDNGQKQLLMPIELADELKEDGVIFVMKYRVSRIAQTGCLKGTPIIIDEYMKL